MCVCMCVCVCVCVKSPQSTLTFTRVLISEAISDENSSVESEDECAWALGLS